MISEVSFTKTASKEYEKLVRKNPNIQYQVEKLINILSRDPYNLSRRFDIKKLKDVNIGKWRIRNGNYRIRYDIEKNQVIVYGVLDRKKGY